MNVILASLYALYMANNLNSRPSSNYTYIQEEESQE